MPELYASPDIKRLMALSNRVLERLRMITIVRIANGGASDPELWIDGGAPVAHGRAGGETTWFWLLSR